MSQSLLLLGANGRTGRHVLRLALDAGHRVTALVRGADRLADVAHEGLTVVVGDACDRAVLETQVPGHDVVVSTLGPRMPTRAATAVYPESGAAIVSGMEAAGVTRLVVTSSGLLFPERSWMERLLCWLVPNVVRGASAMEDTIRASDLDWTIVRTGFLNDADDPAHRVEFGAMPPRPGAVSRRAVAGFLMSQIAPDAARHRTVVGLCG